MVDVEWVECLRRFELHVNAVVEDSPALFLVIKTGAVADTDVAGGVLVDLAADRLGDASTERATEADGCLIQAGRCPQTRGGQWCSEGGAHRRPAVEFSQNIGVRDVNESCFGWERAERESLLVEPPVRDRPCRFFFQDVHTDRCDSGKGRFGCVVGSEVIKYLQH